MIEVRTLTQDGQTAAEIAEGVVAFVDAAHRRLDVALYDVRLPGPVGDRVRAALEGAAARGVEVRLIYNLEPDERPRPLPPPPQTEPELIESLSFPTRGIPGEPDLMHHKYLVRDGESVWTGSTNWSLNSWRLEENVIAVVDSPESRPSTRRTSTSCGTTRSWSTAATSRRVRFASAVRRSARGSARVTAVTSRTGSRTRSVARTAASAWRRR